MIEILEYTAQHHRSLVEMILHIQREEIGREALPEAFPVMEVDKKFYRYDVK